MASSKTERVQVKLFFEVEVEDGETLVHEDCAALAAEAVMPTLFEIKGRYRIQPGTPRFQIEFGHPSIRP